jgi:hypothetical protein
LASISSGTLIASSNWAAANTSSAAATSPNSNASSRFRPRLGEDGASGGSASSMIEMLLAETPAAALSSL